MYNNSKLDIKWNYDVQKKCNIMQVTVNNETNKFEYKNPYFLLKSDTKLIDKIWWQVSKEKGFNQILSNFDNITSYKPIIELSEISNTFFNSNENYYLRIKAFKDGVWGEWSNIYEFSVRKPSQPKGIKITIENDDRVSFLWDGDYSENTEFYIFGSNRLDFLPDIYSNLQIDEMLNGQVETYSENKNLVCVTNSKKVVIDKKFSYYRIIAKKEQAYSIPSDLIKLDALLVGSKQKVLQIRHKIENAPETKLGYKDFYRAKILDI